MTPGKTLEYTAMATEQGASFTWAELSAISAAFVSLLAIGGIVGQWFVTKFRSEQTAARVTDLEAGIEKMADDHAKFRELVVGNYVQRPEVKAFIDEVKASIEKAEVRLERSIADVATAVRELVTKQRPHS